MSSKFKKIIKCLITFSFIFTIVGCGSSAKSIKQMEKLIKRENLDFLAEPYELNQDVRLGYGVDRKWFYYDEDGLKFSDTKTIEDDKPQLLNEIKNKKKIKSYEKFYDDYGLAKEDIENYLKEKYNSSTKKFNDLSYKDRFLYTWKNGLLSNDTNIKDGKKFLNSLSKKEIEQLYSLLMKNEKSIDVSLIGVRSDYYKYLVAPSKLSTIIDKLEDTIDKHVDVTAFSFKKIEKDGDDTYLFYKVDALDDSFDGEYAFAFDKNGKINSMALFYYDFDSSDLVYEYAGYLIYAAEKKVSSVDEGTEIAENSYDTINSKNGYDHSLIVNNDTNGFLMQPSE